ncbi:T9SS type A sorting domain-containing protein [candidate division KSB1 bacterium]|nr:T9SS type A sorting domain-containing protein [candidate division KSB1 bacterium]
MIKTLTISLFIIIGLFQPVFGFASLSVLESDDSHLVIRVADIDLSFREMIIDGEICQQIQPADDMGLTSLPGQPQLPFFSVNILIPGSELPELRVIEKSSVSTYHALIAPAPAIDLHDTKEGGYLNHTYRLDPIAYNQDRFTPENIYRLSQIMTVRSKRMATLYIYPVSYNPVKQELAWYDHLTIELTYRDNQSNFLPISSTHVDPFDPYVKKIIANPNKISSSIYTDRSLEKVSTTWRTTDQPWYKMKIAEDGLFRLHSDYLENFNVPLQLHDPANISIYNKGAEIPIYISGEADGYFDETDYIEFYATMNYGDTTYYDAVTDTNVFWLTFGETAGLRFEERSVLSGEFAEMATYRHSMHLENNSKYYSGDVALQIVATETSPGEGWYWDMFYKNDVRNYIIDLPNIDLNASELCTLEVRLRGTTNDSIEPDHHAIFSLNNEYIDEIKFDGRSTVTHKIPVKHVDLSPHNTFNIKSSDTGASLNAFYLDWIKIQYFSNFDYKDTDILFECDSTGDKQISLWNSRGSNPSIFNLTENYLYKDYDSDRIQRWIINAESAGFNDGNFARIYANGNAILANGKRGINVATFDMTNDQFLENKHFDTFSSQEQADSLAAYIKSQDTTKIIILAIKDEGSYALTDSAKSAIRSIGSSQIDQLQYRDSWVIIGRRNAIPGTVPEKLMPQYGGPAVVSDTVYTSNNESFHIRFADHFKKGDRYLISAIDSVRTPASFIVTENANLTDESNRADYIMIYHPAFREVTQRVSDFWTDQGLRTMIVDVEDIYDEFNYGVKNPIALKNFLQYAYRNWTPPAPTYVLLIGDASWDPKMNSETSMKKDFIPAYGNPVSDHWFVCLDGEDDMLADMFIGRLPIESVEQGLNYIDKMKTYVNLPSAAWKKHMLFINGGFDDTEQAVFGAQTDRIVSEYITPPPASIVPNIISKELDGLYEGEKREDITRGINDGQLWVNFIGHGGSGTWELMFHDEQVFQLQNKVKMPFVTSLTCHTGRFANPEITNFGENFVLIPGNGAIGFMGSSGWGFVAEDEQFARRLFKSVFVDTVQGFGAAITLAKLKLWTESGQSVSTRSVVYQYSLLGDPALNLTLPDKPDIVADQSSLTWDVDNPVESDSTLSFDVSLYNYGLATADSVRFSIVDRTEGSENEIYNDLLPPIGFRQDTEVDWSLKGMAGQHQLMVSADPVDEITEFDETNNSATFPITVGSSRIFISRPVENALISTDQPVLQIYHPEEVDSKDHLYLFEVDTSATFNSSQALRSNPVEQGLIITKWETPSLSMDQVYHWRCRINEEEASWIYSSFKTNDSRGWLQSSSMEMNNNVRMNIAHDKQSYKLENKRTLFHVESSGLNDLNMAVLFVDNMAVSEIKRGFNMAVCDRFGNFIEANHFDTYGNQEHVDAMINFINDVPFGYYVLAGIKDTGARFLNEESYQVLESIGSQYCRDVGFRDAWAIIGRKGASVGSVPEKHVKRYEGTAVLDDTLVTYHSSGNMISTEIGPSNGWNILRWEASDTSDHAKITIDVLGKNEQSVWDTLMTGLTNPNGNSLKSIDHKNYRKLKLRANFSTDKPFYSPALHEWSVEYDPVSDLAISQRVVEIDSDSIIVGQRATISAEIHNVGEVAADSVLVRFFYSNSKISRTSFADQYLYDVPPDSYRTVSQSWQSTDITGMNRIYIDIDPEDRILELNEGNNTVTTRVDVAADTTTPHIELMFDGKEIVDGSYVARQPVIDIRISDDVPLTVAQDTAMVSVMLDDQRISYFDNNQLTIMPISPNPEEDIKAWLRLTPELEDGEHTVHVFVQDGSGNQNAHRIQFVIESELRIIDVLNYPNPFSYDTNFTYFLTQPADDVTIKIYTVAGRLILTLHHCSADAGFNKVPWSGLDQDYDSLANGVYLYKIIVRAGDQQAEVVEKLVVMR